MNSHVNASLAVLLVFCLTSCISDAQEETVQICIPANSCPDIPTTVTVVEGDQERGSAIFEKACATCHGDDGRGMREKGTHDLTDHGYQKKTTDRQIRMLIRMGKGKMPSFVLPSQQLADLLVYVRSLDSGAPKGRTKQGY
jgi:mono/diheme cytochrome c family protein